jgi:hypothetical protein
MSDNIRTSGAASNYRTGQDDSRGNFGRDSSYDGGTAYEAYGRQDARPVQVRDRSYRETYGYRRDRGWSDMADSGTIMALAIGAGLGLLAGTLITSGASRRPWTSWQGDSGRQWSGDRSRSSRSLETDESTDLISSNKVEGTAVYDRQGNKLGEVYNFMVGKRSGRVAYAVLTFGGLLGMGGSHYPLPWSTLDYDPEKGGYVVDLDKDQLSRAPSHGATEDGFAQPGYGRRVSDFWLVTGSRPGGF